MRARCLHVLIVIFPLIASSADAYGPSLPRSDIPDNASIREAYVDIVFAPAGAVASMTPVVERDSETGLRVRIESTVQNGSVYLLFLNQRRGAFPLVGPGNWIIKRDTESGRFIQLKVFLQDSPGTFLRIFPHGAVSRMDVYLEGNLLHESVPLKRPFDEIVTAPLSRIVELTRYLIDWGILFPQRSRPQDGWVFNIVTALRDRLPALVDSDDGALDSDGTYRFIEDLTENLAGGFNCSGFAKWVVDGVRYPLSGDYLGIEEVKRKHFETRGNEWSAQYEDARDPYFGLDWTRNLALSVIAARSSSIPSLEAADVRRVRYYDYIDDVGYAVDDLRTILYLLTLDRPGSIYLGSVNRAFGSDPVLRQHVHVVVLLPYMDESGTFRVAVMERNIETSTQSLQARYSGDFIHLVEVPVGPLFAPPDT